MRANDSFGELALINDKPRANTIEATEFTILAVLTKEDFSRILLAEAEKNMDEKVDFLQKLPIFAGSSKNTLQKLSYFFNQLSYIKNQVVYRDNMPSDMIYFIEEGEFQVSINQDQISKKIIEVPTGFVSNQKSLIKIDKAREVKQSYQLQVVIRSRYDILGYEEYVSGQALRVHCCKCISSVGRLYAIKSTVNFT